MFFLKFETLFFVRKFKNETVFEPFNDLYFLSNIDRMIFFWFETLFSVKKIQNKTKFEAFNFPLFSFEMSTSFATLHRLKHIRKLFLSTFFIAWSKIFCRHWNHCLKHYFITFIFNDFDNLLKPLSAKCFAISLLMLKGIPLPRGAIMFMKLFSKYQFSRF